MKLVNIKAYNIEYKNYILIESIDDLNEYYVCRKKQIHRACDHLRENKYGSELAGFGIWSFLVKRNAKQFNHKEYGSVIRELININGHVYETQLRYILNSKKIAINIKGGYMPLPDDFTYEQINIDSELNNIFKPKRWNEYFNKLY